MLSPDPASAPAALRERALDVLLDPSLAHIVDLVCYPDGGDIVVANSRGAVRLSRTDHAAPAEPVWGRDPVADQDPLAFTPLTAELADASPPNERNAYPFAAARLASLFADVARAPDLAVAHTGRHYWPERGGHLGEHGSLDVVQSRAPLLLSGAGVIERGYLAAAARVVDVGPTLAWLAGTPLADLAGLDGAALVDLLVPRQARRVIGMLWDGVNSNSLLSLTKAGELPAVARLLERGCALAGGAVAEFPSNTLVNHTSALTGLGPGRHGIVSNEFYDRDTSLQVIANTMTGWHTAMDLLRPGVRTVFQQAGGAGTACVNEPVDVGAAYSTFQIVREGAAGDGVASMRSHLPDPRADAHATLDLVAANEHYAFSSAVDAIGLVQMLQLFESRTDAPRLTWWNTMLTDTGHHEGGPHSPTAHAAMRDADRRLGAFLDHLDRIDAFDDTVFLLTADHGSEGADVDCRGDWDDALRGEGIRFRDEAYGFLYLGVGE